MGRARARPAGDRAWVPTWTACPNGGAFDGALGVLAALEAVQSLRERGERPRRSVVVLAFADEEGNNFGIGVLSAQLWIGEIPPERYGTIQRPGGPRSRRLPRRVRRARRAAGERPALAAYVEAHVEQGPVLDTEGRPAAAVESIVGLSRSTVTFTGRANHAGTTPMALRRDALWGGAELALAVRDLAVAAEGRAVGTVGVFEVGPGATNVIPGSVRMRVEIRSPDEDRLTSLRAEVERTARACAERHGLDVHLDAWHHAPAVPMDPVVRRATEDALEDAGLPRFTMPSWAGHDAKVLARRLPVGMVFVPSVGGVSHAPDEETSAADCATAAELLYHAVRRLDRALDASPSDQEVDPR